MKFNFPIYKNKYLRAFFGLSFLALIFLAAIFLAKTSDIKSPLLIHFDVYRGMDIFGGKLDILEIIITAFIIILINFFLADFFYWREKFFSYLLGVGSLILMILILIGVGVIIAAN